MSYQEPSVCTTCGLTMSMFHPDHSAEREAPDMRAHRLASEMTMRVKWGKALGVPSFYNIAREVLIEEFAAQHNDGSSESLEANYAWVEQVQTVDAIDVAVVEAINNNPGWHLIGVGTGSGGQTTLTYGWPWPGTKHYDGSTGGINE